MLHEHLQIRRALHIKPFQWWVLPHLLKCFQRDTAVTEVSTVSKCDVLRKTSETGEMNGDMVTRDDSANQTNNENKTKTRRVRHCWLRRRSNNIKPPTHPPSCVCVCVCPCIWHWYWCSAKDNKHDDDEPLGVNWADTVRQQLPQDNRIRVDIYLGGECTSWDQSVDAKAEAPQAK